MVMLPNATSRWPSATERRTRFASSTVGAGYRSRPRHGPDPRGWRRPSRSPVGKAERFLGRGAWTPGTRGMAVALRRHGYTELLEGSIPGGVSDGTRSIMYRGRLSFQRHRDGRA